MFDKIYGELKAVPVTMILLALLYIAVVSLYKDHVSISEMSLLREQILNVEYTLRFDHLDSRKHQIETELFNLNNTINDKTAKHLEADPIYYQRIDELKNEDNEINREIVQLKTTQIGNSSSIMQGR